MEKEEHVNIDLDDDLYPDIQFDEDLGSYFNVVVQLNVDTMQIGRWSHDSARYSVDWRR
jgi:hypothetical protein